MRTTLKLITALTCACLLIVPTATRAGELKSFLQELNVSASADLGSFKADLSVTFGESGPKIDGLFALMDSPADVYMTLRIGELADRPIDQVVEVHRQYKGQGWGVIAKNMGIKPGSAEFHALKDNRLDSHSGGGSSGKQGKGKKKG